MSASAKGWRLAMSSPSNSKSNYVAHVYLIALGSNQHHSVLGAPEALIAAALERLGGAAMISRLIRSDPLGPSRRRYANAVAVIESGLIPPAFLARLKAIEAEFGRKSRGERWRARTVDLDIILWSGGIWMSRELTIPHREFRTRRFVLAPACHIAGDWRDPMTGLKLRHLFARLDRKRPRA